MSAKAPRPPRRTTSGTAAPAARMTPSQPKGKKAGKKFAISRAKPTKADSVRSAAPKKTVPTPETNFSEEGVVPDEATRPRKEDTPSRGSIVPDKKAQGGAILPPRLPFRADAAELLGSRDDDKDEIAKRRHERDRAKRRLIAKRFFLAFMGIAMVAVLIWVFFFSPFFALNTHQVVVSLEGNEDQVDVAKVEQIVQQEVGTPLLRINTRSIQSQILQLPSVSSAEVKAVWPNGMEILITPREPKIAVPTDSGFQLLGEDAVVVATVAEVPEGVLLVEVGEGGSLSRTDVAEVAGVWDSLEQGVRDQVASLSLSGGIITLSLESGAKVNWGSADQSALKNKVLSLLLEQRPSSVYDVTDPTRPSVK